MKSKLTVGMKVRDVFFKQYLGEVTEMVEHQNGYTAVNVRFENGNTFALMDIQLEPIEPAEVVESFFS